MTDILFAKAPKDLPTDLVLTQGVESNHERYQFALNYSRSLGEGQRAEKKQTGRDWHTNVHHQGKNPNFSKWQPVPNSSNQASQTRPAQQQNTWQGQGQVSYDATKSPYNGTGRLTATKN